jgi:nitrous oxidase accessory protein
LRRNTVTKGRYGTHFMYSHGNAVEDSRYLGNEVGIFVMYCQDVRLERNVLLEGRGAAGMGLGIKESGNVVARKNRIAHNTQGIYLDTSPLQADHHNTFEENELRLSQVAVVFHSSSQRNTFTGNTFRDNHQSVEVEGGGDALGVLWTGNDWDDYAGYDLDRDGVGDVPHEARSLADELVSRHPQLAFFRGAPALALVRVAGKVVPLFAPKAVLRDDQPRTRSLPDAP